MRALIACEHSGTVREQFRALGHDAWSCDLLPATDGSLYHFQGDALQIIRGDEWDIVIAHPPCTYLTNSAAWAFNDPDFERYPGVGYHQKVKPGTLTGADRRAAREEAIAFALALWNCGAKRICIENPVGALSAHLGKAQIVQPYQFGDDASKGTCLWLKGLPPLVMDPAKRRAGRWLFDPHTGKAVERWANQTDAGQNRLSPSEDRGHLRAITYSGIALAMAEQWGGRSRIMNMDQTPKGPGRPPGPATVALTGLVSPATAEEVRRRAKAARISIGAVLDQAFEATPRADIPNTRPVLSAP